MSAGNNSSSVSDELLTTTFTGEHDVQTDNLFSESETIGWEFDERALFKTVAFRIYRSDEAGVREPLLNAITSGLRAQILHDLDDPKVGVYLYEGDDDTPMTLVIRDNGVGIDEDTLRNSLMYVGRSQNRWVADLVGKFGVGFLASFRLVSETGVFFMHTKARETGEEFRGVLSSGGFEVDKGDELPDVFGDDEYGTRLEFPIKDDISRADIRNWVSKHAERARIPVEYKEEGFDETERDPYSHFDPVNVETVYGGIELGEDYDPTAPVIRIEHDAFVALCSPESSGETLSLDTPVRRGFSMETPFEVDIRFLSENGPIVDGPHEGKTPVSESEIREIPTNLRDGFVLEDELTEADIRAPHPTGSREVLSRETDFGEWLAAQFRAEYEETANDAMEKIESFEDMYTELTDNERRVLIEMTQHIREYRHSTFKDGVDKKFGCDVPDEVVDALALLMTEIEVIPRKDDNTPLADRRPMTKKVYEVYETAEGDVFMGSTLHPVKASIAHADDEDNVLVKLPRKSKGGRHNGVKELYAAFETTFGWKKLKEIKTSTLDEYNVPEELEDALKNGIRNTEDGIEKRTLTLHMANKDHQFKWTVGHLCERMEAIHNDNEERESLTWEYNEPTRVVTFPSTEDANLSDHYDIGTSTTAVAYCTKKVAAFLDSVPGVTRYSQLAESAREVEFTTSEGVQTINSTPTRLAIHVVGEDEYDTFSRDDLMDDFADYLVQIREAYFTEPVEDPEELDEGEEPEMEVVTPTYAPMTADTFEQVFPDLPSSALVMYDRSSDLNGLSVSRNLRVTNTKMYAHAMLSEWRGSAKFSSIMSNPPSFTNGGKEMVDALNTAKAGGFTFEMPEDDETDENDN